MCASKAVIGSSLIGADYGMAPLVHSFDKVVKERDFESFIGFARGLPFGKGFRIGRD